MVLRKIVFAFLLCVEITHSGQKAENYFREEGAKIYNLCGRSFEIDSQKDLGEVSGTSTCLSAMYGNNVQNSQFFETLTIEYLKDTTFVDLGISWSRYSCLQLLNYTILSLANFGRVDECRHVIDLAYELIGDEKTVFVPASENCFYEAYGPLALINSALNPRAKNEPEILAPINSEAAKIIKNTEKLEQEYLGEYQQEVDNIEDTTSDRWRKLKFNANTLPKWSNLDQKKHEKIEKLIAPICRRLGVSSKLASIWVKKEYARIRALNIDLPLKMQYGTNAEYVFYKENREISQRSKNSIYGINTTIRFSMNANPLNAEHVKQLPQEELDANEPEVVRSQVMEIDPDVRMLLIPKSMYQLFVLLVFLEELPAYEEFRGVNSKEADKKRNQWLERGFSMRYDKGKYSRERLRNPMYAVSKSYLESESTRDLFWRVGDRVIKFMEEVVGIEGIKNFTRAEFTTVCNALIEKITKEINKVKLCTAQWPKWDGITNFFYLQEKLGEKQKQKSVQDHMKWVLEQEYNTMGNPAMKGTYRIYRGVVKTMTYAPNVSSSFGDGAFSSVIFSPKGDMPFNIALRRGVLAYIDIDKNSYRTTQDRPVFIPPISSGLVAPFGDGEFHHPRTKVIEKTGDEIPGVDQFHATLEGASKDADSDWLITRDPGSLNKLLKSIKVYNRSFSL